MASNYLRKTVGDRRTGANLIGINVDTSNMRNLSPMYKEAFNKLEAFATEMDNIKIENEQTKLALDLAKNKLDFEKKYLSDPSVYLNEDKFNAMVAASEKEFRQVGEKLIANSIYLDTNQKNELLGKFNLQYSEMVYKAQGKRNEAYIQQTVDFNRNNIEMAKQLASVDEDNTEMYFDEIKKSYNSMLKTGIFTQENININLAKDISDVGIAQLEIKVEKDIINNPNLTIEEKQTKLQEFYSTLTDDGINKFVDGVVKTENMNDDVRKYMTAGMKYRQEVLKNNLNEKMSTLKTAKKMVDYENSKKIEEAYYKKDTYNFFYYTTGIKTGTKDLLNNTNGYLDILAGRAEDKTNIGIFGDIYNDKVFPFLSSGIIQGINAEIRSRRQGDIPYTTREIFQPIYDAATELSKDENGSMAYLKRNAIIKDYGLRNGINPTILFLGENNPEVFRINDTLGIGARETKRYKEETGEELNIKNLGMGWTASKNFKKFSESISDNKILGEYYATQYVLGNMLQQGITIEELLKSPKASLARILGDDQTDLFLKDAQTINQITTQRRDFKYINFKDPRIKEEIIPQSQNTEITAQAGAFGGD